MKNVVNVSAVVCAAWILMGFIALGARDDYIGRDCPDHPTWSATYMLQEMLLGPVSFYGAGKECPNR